MTTPTLNPARAAETLLERWWLRERPLHIALQSPSRQAQRLALREAASYFTVVRSLRRSFDEGRGMPRLEPLRQCLSRISPAHASEGRFVEATIATARAIASRYGGQNYLSAASKLLWLRFLHPFIIYDSVVRESLGTPRGDYLAYVAAWERRYLTHEDAIASACTRLSRASLTFQPPTGLSETSVKRPLRETWFRRRILDLVIWNGGV